MARIICDACGKSIRQDTAFLTVNTPTTSQRWHMACCPLIRPAHNPNNNPKSDDTR